MRKFYFLLLFALLGMVANAGIPTSTSSTFYNGGFSNKDGGEFRTSEGEFTWVISKALGYCKWSNENCIQFGAGSDPAGEYTLSTSTEVYEVTKVDIEAKVAKSGNVGISVNVGEQQLGQEITVTESNFKTYSFEGSKLSGKVVLNINGKAKAHYIKKITLYYTQTKTATPKFNLSEGTYNDVQTVELSCSTDNSTITYKINDSEEKTYSPDAPIQLVDNGTYTITAWAKAESLEQSEVATAVYTIEKICAEPVFSLSAGSYMISQTLELTCATDGATINYTINDGNAQVYSEPINLNQKDIYAVKAWTTKDGFVTSQEVYQEYIMEIVDGLKVEDFDFVAIGQKNNYPTGSGGTSSFASGDVTVSTTQEGSTPNRFWNNWTEYRMYGGATLTFTVPEDYVITSIELTPASTNVSGEGYSKGVWTGELQTVTLNLSGNVNFTDFVVHYKPFAENQPASPTFSLEKSGFYEGNQQLTITAEDDATITYRINGGETVNYENPIELTSQVGKYVVEAWANKNGVTSLETTRIYVIEEEYVANNIEEFKTLGVKAALRDRFVTINCPLTVVYQNGGDNGTSDLYVKDAAGDGLLIYNSENSKYETGSVLPAGLKGKYKDYNGLVEMVNPENFGDVTEEVDVEAEVKTANTVTADDMSKLVVVKNAELSTLESKNATLTDASGTITVYDKYGISDYPTDLDKKYNVTAIVNVYNDKVQLYPVSIEEYVEPVASPEFSLEAGTYEGEQELELTCSTADATIHYTINEDEEQTYTGAITLAVGKYEIVAWATKEGMTDSEKVTRSYEITEKVVPEQVASPKFSLEAETYEGEQKLELTCSTADATIHYTINEGEEKTYTGAITLAVGKYEIVAWATKEGMTDSEKVTRSYEITEKVVPEQVASPEFSLEAGTYEGEQELELTCSTAGATIHYTINDGEEQTYTEAITLAVGEYEIVAWATKDGMTDSGKVTKSYEILDEEVGLSSVQSGKPSVYATGNTIVISVENETLVGIYNMVGQLVRTMVIPEGETTLDFASGIYLVKAGEKTVKVIVK